MNQPDDHSRCLEELNESLDQDYSAGGLIEPDLNPGSTVLLATWYDGDDQWNIEIQVTYMEKVK